MSASWLKAQMAILPPLGTVLHLGAGTGRDFDAYRESRAKSIVLVEPDVEALFELRTKVSGIARVNVLTAAVGKLAGTAPLRRFNFSERNSLCEPSRLSAMLPGLFRVAPSNVRVRSATDLVQQIEPSEHETNCLIVDVPGMSGHVIQDLAESNLLHRFTNIFLFASIEPLYVGAVPLVETLRRLEEHGYRQVGVADVSDPTWPRYHFALSADAVARAQLEADLESSERQRRQLEHDLCGTISNLEQKRSALEHDLEARGTELDQARQDRERIEQELRGAIAKLEHGLEARGTELDQARHERERIEQELRGTVATLEHDLEARGTELDQVRQERERIELELRGAIAKLEHGLEDRATELEQARKERERLEQKLRGSITDLERQREELEKNLNTRETELSEARTGSAQEVDDLKGRLESLQSDLSVSIRLQRLREADLKELQERYAAILDLKERQEALLVRLRQKLKVASEHLKQIDAQTDESARRDLASHLVRALAGEAGND